jgi:hypothetical protein
MSNNEGNFKLFVPTYYVTNNNVLSVPNSSVLGAYLLINFELGDSKSFQS